MSDPQRTHKASPKRVREFRKRGDIALSRDGVSAAALLGGAIGLISRASSSFEALRLFVASCARSADGHATGELARSALATFITAVAPILVGAALGALAAILGQLGWPPAWKGIHFDLARISPHKNLGQTWGPQAMVRRTATAIAKITVVGAIVALTLRGDLMSNPVAANEVVGLASSTLKHVLIVVVAALVTLALGDYILARRRIASQMKMTADEMKREHREADGDPHIKGKRRQRMKELAKRRIASAVAKADVVVVNPTHFAVALRYTEGKDRAPMVVAKGTDEVAAKIREIARKHSVPVLSRPPLARALYKNVKEGRAVPANLYRAVAEVLAYVYRLRRR